MWESLRADGRAWVPTFPDETGRTVEIPDKVCAYLIENSSPSWYYLVPPDVAKHSARATCDRGRGVRAGSHGMSMDFGKAPGL